MFGILLKSLSIGKQIEQCDTHQTIKDVFQMIASLNVPQLATLSILLQLLYSGALMAITFSKNNCTMLTVSSHTKKIYSRDPSHFHI